MRSRSMTMRPFSIGAPPLPSMMRTLSRTIGRVCAVSAAAIHSAIATPAQAVIHRSEPCIVSILTELRTQDRALIERAVRLALRALRAMPRGAAHAKQRPRGVEPAALQPLGEPAVPVERIDDDRPAVRRAERRAHERSRGLIVGRHHRTDLIEEAPGPSETVLRRRRPCRSRARTAAAPTSAHSRRIRRWAPKTRSSCAITAGRSAGGETANRPRREVGGGVGSEPATARRHDASARPRPRSRIAR